MCHSETCCSTFVQVCWCFITGKWALGAWHLVSVGNHVDCFLDLGSYKVCNATLLLFAYSNLFLLMLQALVSRILVPGMSNFVNASVR
jgi:hypothetical protein